MNDKKLEPHPQQIIKGYRTENAVLRDKLDNSLNELKEVRKLLSETQEQIDKLIQTKGYWKTKYERKTSWSGWLLGTKTE